jgi:hypothetical protein
MVALVSLTLRKVIFVLTPAGAIAALLWPALWNGFPIVFYDTGGYLTRPFTQTLELGRSALFGAFLAGGIPLNFWPNIVVQAVVVAWVLTLELRAQGLSDRLMAYWLVIIALSGLTGLPWYAAQLMPDVLVPVTVLALHLLAVKDTLLRRWERATLVVIVSFAIASHMTILALALGLLAVAGFWCALSSRLGLTGPLLRHAVLAITLGLFISGLSNLVIGGHFGFTPGGMNFLFARLVQDGIVSLYLADRCLHEVIALCQYQHDIAAFSTSDWLWDEDSPLYKLGGPDAFASEAQRIVIATAIDYPIMHIRTAFKAALDQFGSFATGDGIDPLAWNTYWALEKFAPKTFTAFVAARQQQGSIDFTVMNAIHVPVGWLAIGALPLILLASARRLIPPNSADLAATTLIALAGNAFICGALSNPHDRYQSRLIPLALLSIIVAALSYRVSAVGTNRDALDSLPENMGQPSPATR